MRYLGNKTNLLNFIQQVIKKHDIQGQTFADLFAGTGSVGDYFKGEYTVLSNDYMYFSKVISEAKLLNSEKPKFDSFVKRYGKTPFQWLNEREYTPNDGYFVYNNYTPRAERMYLTEENALKIDGMRLDIEELFQEGVISKAEYSYLLASLLESVTKVSNTSGTYQAFFKFWESRALKKFTIMPLEMKDSLSVSKDNRCFNKNTNRLVREISGDIAYIDPPYTITQYTNSYHVLETIARYDNPELFGKTGRRVKREFSGYSNKSKAYYEFEDLFRQINFTHVLVSYSNQSIVPLDELVDLARRFAVDGIVEVETNEYREYSTNNSSMKGEGKKLQEVIIYFKKNLETNKSPLNYAGSKDDVIPRIFKLLPKHVTTFVDAMGGAFNMGANATALNKVVYNEYHPFVFEMMQMIVNTPADELIRNVEQIVTRYSLEKKGKEAFNRLRDHYNNEEQTPINLYTLNIYSFQNILRFNQAKKYNTPIGNNEFNEGYKDRITRFVTRAPEVEMRLGSYSAINFNEYDDDTVFYFDPPYLVTTAGYNDGKRGFDGWDAEQEASLLKYLTELDSAGKKFMLSNVLEHKGKTNHLLMEWIQHHGFNVNTIGETGIKYPRREILVTNYNTFER